MKRILIVDLSSDGHHPRYLKWIAEGEACRASDVVVAGKRELLEHRELESVIARVQAHEVRLSAKQESILRHTSSAAALARRQWMIRNIWQKTYEAVSLGGRVDLVLLAFADECLDVIALAGSPFGSTPWMGITHRAMFHLKDAGVIAPPPRLAFARQWLFRRALREPHLTGLFTIDPILAAFADRHFSAIEKERSRFLPDPASQHELQPRNAARDSLGVPRTARVILAYGALSERKGIRALVDCAADAKCPSNIHVVLAGKQEPALHRYLENGAAATLRSQGRLHAFDEYQTDSDEVRLVSAADCMWVGYRGFYTMSGILLLAARHGIPSIVSEAGIVGYLAKKYNLGMIVDPDDRASVLGALERTSADASALFEWGANGKRAFHRHSIAEFQREISALVWRAVGSPAEERA